MPKSRMSLKEAMRQIEFLKSDKKEYRELLEKEWEKSYEFQKWAYKEFDKMRDEKDKEIQQLTDYYNEIIQKQIMYGCPACRK